MKEFKNRCQKRDDENYLFDKYVFRKISIYGTYIFSKFNVQPNTITFLSLVASIGSLWFFMQNEAIYLVIGAILAFTYNYLDHVDGELARFYISKKQYTPSLKGPYFDVLCHSYSANLYLLCISFALYKELQHDYVFVMGVISMLGASMFARLVAARVFMAKISKQPKLMETEEARKVLDYLDKSKCQVEAVNAPLMSKEKIMKIFEELFGYPGVISLIIISCIVDAAFESTVARLTLLVVLSTIRIVHLPVIAIKSMKILDEIK